MFKKLRGELKALKAPTFKEALKTSAYIFGSSVLVAAVVWLFDYGVEQLVMLIF